MTTVRALSWLMPSGSFGGRRFGRLIERNVAIYRRGWYVLASGLFEPLFYLLVTNITNYRSIQWKGVIVQEPAPRTPGDLALMHRHVAAFTAGSALVGIRPEVLPSIFPDEVVALELELDARYDQTPGTGAGRQVA